MTNERSMKKVGSVRAKSVSAREMGTVLAQLAKLIGSRPTGNRRIGDALVEASKILESFGQMEFREAFSERLPSSAGQKTEHVGELSQLPLARVQQIATDPDTPRRFLIDLAVSRFRLSRSSLERKSAHAVREELITAVQHENSISIISEVARRGR